MASFIGFAGNFHKNKVWAWFGNLPFSQVFPLFAKFEIRQGFKALGRFQPRFRIKEVKWAQSKSPFRLRQCPFKVDRTDGAKWV